MERIATYGVVTGALESHDTRLLCQTPPACAVRALWGGAGDAGCCGIMGERGARSLPRGPERTHWALPKAKHRVEPGGGYMTANEGPGNGVWIEVPATSSAEDLACLCDTD